MFTPTFFLASAIIAVVSYLLGSLNCAIIVSHFHAGEDVRHHGSGNAGMTNILRTYGVWPAVFTALGDLIKAVLAVGFARFLFHILYLGSIDAGYIAGVCVVLGHLYPIYFRFRGGKGVMTSLGVILIVNPVVFLILAAIFIPLVFITRIVSLGSILGAVAFPILTYLIRHFQGRPALVETLCACIFTVIIVWKHKDNIKRLLNGTENKFGGKPK